MPALGVVEGKAGFQPGMHLRERCVILEIHILILDRPPEPFDEDVIGGPPAAVPADPDRELLQGFDEFLAGELAPLVGVKDLRSAEPVQGVLKAGDAEGRVQGVAQPPGQYLPALPVQDRHQIPESPNPP
jgi:hypothetical protein